jgi:hypothetical protein
VITVSQLAAVGIARRGVGRRVDVGRLHRVHRGVYAVGHPGLSPEGRWIAAVLACGDTAVLSHGDAAVLWGLLRPLGGPVHVSVPTSSGVRQRRGIRLHRCTSLRPVHVTTRLGIRVTNPARTIDDLRGSVAPRIRRRARRQAEVFGLLEDVGPGAD